MCGKIDAEVFLPLKLCIYLLDSDDNDEEDL